MRRLSIPSQETSMWPSDSWGRACLSLSLFLCACSAGSGVEQPNVPDNDGFATQGRVTADGPQDAALTDAGPIHDTGQGPVALDVAEWSEEADTPLAPADTETLPSDAPSEGFGDMNEPSCPDCGTPCDDDSECFSGWCVEGPDGDICTKTCEADCPPGMSCQGVNTGASEITYICVPEHIYYCRPCTSQSECTPPLLDTSPHRCLEHSGGAGSFCATACSTTADCPAGGVCMVVDVAGESLQLCQPADEVCSCNAAAISVGATTTCSVSGGFGVCEGQRSCTPEGLSECDALEVAVETCNGLDDDCDGATDEAFPLLGEPCDGEDEDICITGEWTCHGGELICNEWNGPTPEICNGADDDCDGSIDEGFEQVGMPCDGPDEDACEEGQWVCLDGDISCDDLSATTLETCNGLDDDCDSNTDEAFAESGLPCDGEDPDQCTDGVTLCVEGALFCQDASDGLAETCNDQDDDCDGKIDENFTDKGEACDGSDADLCADGIWACSEGLLACNDDAETQSDLCNDIDDDCDGAVDEGWSNKGAPCDGPDSDECLDGQYVCNGTSLICSDDATASVETCNNIDDDCDGQTDEGLSQPCTSACGEGFEICAGGNWIDCTAPSALTCTDYGSCQSVPLCGGTCPNPPSEVCDLQDNDCDGATDEGYLGDSSFGLDFVDAWSDMLPFMGSYPGDTNGAVYGKLLPLGDIDWFTIEATEDLSDWCVTDGQDEAIKATLVLNAPGGSVNYQMCACWSSNSSLCAKSEQTCVVSNGGANATINLNADMNCGSEDVVYLDVQVSPAIALLDYGCDNWSVSWSVDE